MQKEFLNVHFINQSQFDGSWVEWLPACGYRSFLLENECVIYLTWETVCLFFQRSKKYKDNILGIKPKFAIEAGIIHGWENFVNPKNFIGMKSYGKSGPYKKLYEHFGITYKSLIKMIKDRI